MRENKVIEKLILYLGIENIMKRYVCIREDDISYFTKQKHIDMLYYKVLDTGIVNFAIIPSISSNIKLGINSIYKREEGIDYSPMIPIEYRGQLNEYYFGDNKDLLNYLLDIDNLSVSQHGFSHEIIDGVYEFKIKNRDDILYRSSKGNNLLKKWFGKSPDFFVPPWDALSYESIEILKDLFLGVTVTRINPLNLPKYLYGAYMKNILTRKGFIFYDRMLIIEHSGYLISRFESPRLVFEKVKKALLTNKINILVNHYWEYFFDWSGVNTDLYDVWLEILDFILDSDDIKLITFGELYEMLR
jgi:hypothetical protein